MKNLYILKKSNLLVVLAFSFLLLSTNAFASFPVKKTNNTETVQKGNVSQTIMNLDDSEAISPIPVAAGYDKWVAAALWLVLGVFAAHRWYAKKPIGWNILYIVTLGGLGIWAIVDIVHILIDKF